MNLSRELIDMTKKKQTQKLVTSLTKDDLLELLKAHNDLKDIIHRADEIHDLYLSDLDKLYTIIRVISDKLDFKPKRCEEHDRALYYSGYVLADDDRAYIYE